MTTLIIGASGATGKLLVDQFLTSGHKIKIIIRATSNIPDSWRSNNDITIISANISEISVAEMVQHLSGCEAVAYCLGHNLSWKGIYGKPRRLVTDAVRLVCAAILKTGTQKPVKLVLMNTAGNSNRDLKEPVSFGQKIVVGLIRLLLPPHADNENAADYLRAKIGQGNPHIEWVAIRPDSLIDKEIVSEYAVHPSPSRSAIFNPGKTSRINVAHFMSTLITDDVIWNKWKGQMPIIYNQQD